MGSHQKADQNNGGSICWLVVRVSRSIEIGPLTEENDATDQTEIAPLLNGTKAKEGKGDAWTSASFVKEGERRGDEPL